MLKNSPLATKSFRINLIIYGIVLLFCFGLKLFYSSASNDALLWIIIPIKSFVQIVSGLPLQYNNELGFYNELSHVTINKECAGVNYLIIVFGASVFGFLHYFKVLTSKLKAISVFLLVSYLMAILISSFRIVTAFLLIRFDLIGTTWHTIQGTIIYFTFLLIYFISLQFLIQKYSSNENTPKTLVDILNH